MKTLYLLFFLNLMSALTFAQIAESQFIKTTTSFDISLSDTQNLLTALRGSTKQSVIAEALNIRILNSFVNEYVAKINSGDPDYGIIFIYREINDGILDPNSSKSLIYHKLNKWHEKVFSNYFLETKNLKIIFIDMDDEYYTDHADADRLSNTKINIEYKESFFKKSVEDLVGALGAMSGPTSLGAKTYGIKFTLVEIDPKRVKAPCGLVLSNKSFTSELKFEIHEKNIASAQIGLVNNKFAINNFSISGGNLIVKADSAEQKEWKSNLYAILEFHLPRDIDNFQPLWKDIFRVPNEFKDNGKISKPGKAIADWFYRNTLHRIGVYGGVKISKDPLSNLYAGFNYAITKELYVNFGWNWANEITPQVTEIGNITSVDEAKQYAKRKYSKPNFSIGLSFSPSSVITMLGLKKKSSE